MDRPLAVGATSGSISALVLKLLAGLSDPSSPLSCPDCPVCFEGLFHLEQVDLPSVVLGLIIGLCLGPCFALVHLARQSWRVWLHERLIALDRPPARSQALYKII